MVVVALWIPLGAAASAARPWSRPIDTSLPTPAASGTSSADERITVTGARLLFAPLPGYGAGDAPWDAARAIRNPHTGTDTTRFGNAFNLGDPLGSDEHSSETGGTLVAPRHP